jgi:hypothetical protein
MRKSRRTLYVLSTAAIAAVGWADRAFATGINSGDLVLFQQNTTGHAGVSIQLDEITTGGSFAQSFTDPNLYTDSAASEGYLSLANGGTQVAYSGYTATNATENTVTSRAVGALNVNGTISYPANTTYTGTSTNNARSAYSSDGVNWYEGDQTSVYYNGTALTGGPSSTHSIKNFGGVTYSFSGSTFSAINPASPTAGTTSVSLSTVVVDPKSNPQDFTLVQSGVNGATYDTMYFTDSTANGSIYKSFFNGSTWSTPVGLSFASGTLTGKNIEDITAEMVGGNAELFITDDSTSTQTSVNGYVYELTDTNTGNASVASLALGNGGSSIYSTTAGTELTGIVFVPEPATIGFAAVAGLGLLLRRRRAISI